MFDLDPDPDVAAALLERAAPDLDPPTALLLEGGSSLPGEAMGSVQRWTVRTAGGAFRLKLATHPAGRTSLVRGARATLVLRARGLPVPEVHAVRPSLDRLDVTAVVERRLGTGDAATAWRALGPAGRAGVEEGLAATLRALHALRPGDLDLPSLARPSGSFAPVEAMALLDGARAVERVPADVRDALRARFEAGWPVPLPASAPAAAPAAARPPQAGDLMPRDGASPPGLGSPDREALCHGGLGLSAVAVERRAFAGVRDFEAVRWGDPWDDVAAFIVSAGESGVAGVGGLVSAYLGGAPPPPGLVPRLDALVGLRRLRACLDLPEEAPPSLLAGLVEALAAWVEVSVAADGAEAPP